MYPAILPALFGTLLLLGSCCTKRDCEGFDDIQQIRFMGFEALDLDSIALETFIAGSDFSVRVDSTFHGARGSTTGDRERYIYLHNGLSRFHDYRFTFISEGSGQVRDLTDLVVKREACNSCFPYHPPSEYFDQLERYSVNRLVMYGPSITILCAI